MNNINNDRMAAFIETICHQVGEGLHERSDDILKAWHESINEAQDNEDKFPKLKVGMSATVDLESAKIETTIRFTTTYQTTISAALPDPNQAELPGVVDAVKKFVRTVKKSGTSVTIESGETTITV